MSLLYEDICPKDTLKNVTKKIRKFYFGDKPIDESTRFDVIDVRYLLFIIIKIMCNI